MERMRNNTILNLFVYGDVLELVTSQLIDLPVVVKRINNQYRVQVLCDYVAIRRGEIEVHYYDREERDFFFIRIAESLIFRCIIFSKEIAPDDFEDEFEHVDDGK